MWFGERSSRHWDSYPEELARILSENGYTDVEVINAGVVGYTSSHMLRKLMTKVLELEPDMIVARIGFNDTASREHRFFSAYYVEEPPGFIIGPLIYRFPESRLVRLLSWVERRAVSRGLRGAGNLISEEDFKNNLVRLAKIAEERGIDLLFLDYPLRDPSAGLHRQEMYLKQYYGVESLEEFHDKHSAYQRIVNEVAGRHGVQTVDTEAAMRAHHAPTFSEYDFVHPNGAGAEVIALEVYDVLKETGFLN